MNINKITKTITMICEIVFFIGAFTSLIIGIVCLCNKSFSINVSDTFDMSGQIFCVGSFSMTVMNMTVDDRAGCISIAMLMSSLLFAAIGMIFRNINLIVRTMEGRTHFSSGPTPFQDNIIRMVRDIGIYAIFIPVYSLIMSITIGCIYPTAECGTAILPAIFGVVIICLSAVFKYGKTLQETEDGLI